MAFYVYVGPRGLIFRVGMVLTGVMGPLTYWWASRRRAPWGSDALVLARGPGGRSGPIQLADVPDDRSLADSIPAGC